VNGQTVVPAGWYDDGSTPGVVRWYDGTAWTEHVRPLEGPPAAPSTAVAAGRTGQWSPGVLDPSLDLPPITAEAPVRVGAPAGQGQHAGYGQPVGFGNPGGYGQPVGFGNPGGYGQPVGFGNPGGYGQPVGFGSGASHHGAPTVFAEAGHHRSRAIGLFWAAVGVLTLGGITGLLADGTHGGVVWTGGLVTGTLLLVRAGISFRAARTAGAPALGGPGIVLAVVTTLVAVVIGVSGLLHYATGLGVGPIRGLPGPVAGSCWRTLSDREVVEVRCSGVHDYTARVATADPADCQILTETMLPIDDGTYLCLVPELTSTT